MVINTPGQAGVHPLPVTALWGCQALRASCPLGTDPQGLRARPYSALQALPRLDRARVLLGWSRPRGCCGVKVQEATLNKGVSCESWELGRTREGTDKGWTVSRHVTGWSCQSTQARAAVAATRPRVTQEPPLIAASRAAAGPGPAQGRGPQRGAAITPQRRPCRELPSAPGRMQPHTESRRGSRGSWVCGGGEARTLGAALSPDWGSGVLEGGAGTPGCFGPPAEG